MPLVNSPQVGLFFGPTWDGGFVSLACFFAGELNHESY